MRWKETRSGKYEDYETSFTEITRVRCFVNCVVFQAISSEQVPVLLIVEPWRGTVTICEYDNYAEREGDIRYLRPLPPGGAADAGVPVRPQAPPPTREAGDARSFPPDRDDR